MIWNAQARFTTAALGPAREGEDAGPGGGVVNSPAESPGESPAESPTPASPGG